MFCKFLLAAALNLFFVFGVSAAELRLDYQYGGEHGVSFKEMPRGPLKLGEFLDARTDADPHTLTAESGESVQSATPLPELIRNALQSGFEAGSAQLVTSNEQLVLDGEMTEFSTLTKAGDIQVTVRAKVRLSNAESGNQLFASSIFGRGSAPEAQGLTAAVSASLDKMVDALMWDDYFLMQVIE